MNLNRQKLASSQARVLKARKTLRPPVRTHQLNLSADWWTDCQKYAQCPHSAAAARFAVSPLLVLFFLCPRTLVLGAFQISQAPVFRNLVCFPSRRRIPSFGLQLSFLPFPLSLSSFSNQSNSNYWICTRTT